MPVGLAVVELSAVEFDVLWEAERLPRRPVVLDVPSPGRTHTERAALVDATMRELADRGLAVPTREGMRAVDELAELLGVLAEPVRSVDVRIWADRYVRMLVAVGGEVTEVAAVALYDRDRVVMRPAEPYAPARDAVSIIGERPAGHGHSVSVPHDVLTAADQRAGGDPARLVSELAAGGVGRDDARTLASMCAGMTARGQFGAEVAGRRAETVVAFHETRAGRYLHTTRHGADGRRWSTITPTDLRRLTTAVTELLASVSG